MQDIRRICSELLDLKDAVENLRGNMQSKFLAFLRISEEVIEMEQELIEIRKHVSAQGILVQDLISGVCRELETWNKCGNDDLDAEKGFQLSEIDELLNNGVEDSKAAFLETVDVLLAEHKVEEVLVALDAEEKKNPDLKESGDSSCATGSSYKEDFMRRKEMLKDLLVIICEQPSVHIAEVKKALLGLVKLGKISLAHQLLLKAYGCSLQKKIEDFLLSCSGYTDTYAATLSQYVFSTISLAAKESISLFLDMPVNTNRIVQWAEYEIESFVRSVKEHLPPLESTLALRSLSICVDAGLSHCSILETQGLKFSKLLMVLLRPQIEEVLDMNFRRARRKIVDLMSEEDMGLPFSKPGSPTITPSSKIMFTSGSRFICIVKDIMGQLTPKFTFHYGGTILNKLLQLFDKYVETLIKALPVASEDDNIMEQKESITFRAETDAEQLALLGSAFNVADELLPMVVGKIFSLQTEQRDDESGVSSGNLASVPASVVEYKDWRRHLQHLLDKLRDYFCRQYVLTFIYSREGKARMDARMYLESKGDDLFWDSDPLPSLPFQALFARLQQLASVAGDVLLGKEKLQKNLLSRLTETVAMWLSEEQEFWDVFEDETILLQPFGLQQLILDMHFIAEIAVCGGYSSRNVHQLVSAIITRAIGTFSERGIDPQSALPEDEWFADTAKAAINKLLLGTSASESSEVELDEHLILHDEISDYEKTPSSPSSTIESSESFASANMDEIESPVFFSDPEA
ncbi:hypothetical protein AXF42_Ash003943 [Apostasia shenzhenica]|uniref:Exocyst component Exo84 C-terminal domain-containing protein n=1 Tax=Apostasia shenzhenica TaxID=1088818 RepID=A0A2I0AIK6_9ASPA|nr:hypothetical protein AXF42_Ash003943 [Apostasia shenzhenica]